MASPWVGQQWVGDTPLNQAIHRNDAEAIRECTASLRLPDDRIPCATAILWAVERMPLRTHPETIQAFNGLIAGVLTDVPHAPPPQQLLEAWSRHVDCVPSLLAFTAACGVPPADVPRPTYGMIVEHLRSGPDAMDATWAPRVLPYLIESMQLEHVGLWSAAAPVLAAVARVARDTGTRGVFDRLRKAVSEAELIDLAVANLDRGGADILVALAPVTEGA